MATYAQLVARLSAENQLSKAQTRRVLKSLVDAVTEALVDETPVRIPLLGTLSTRERQGRIITDPHGRDHKVDPARVVHFSVSKDLRRAVNRRKG